MKRRSQAQRPKTFVEYDRVSTRKQALKEGNIAAQQQKCARVAAERGLERIYHIVDPGISGRYATKRRIRELVEFVKKHHSRIGYLIVEHTNRLHRNNGEQMRLFELLVEYDIVLLTADQGEIDLHSADGRRAAGHAAVEDQYFSDALSEKMSDRHRQALLAGRWPLPEPAAYLHAECANGANLALDESQAASFLRAFELVEAGMSPAEVYDVLTASGGLQKRRANGSYKTIAVPTFYKMLRNPLYMGIFRNSKSEEFPLKHEPLISRETFFAVQRVLDGRQPSTVTTYQTNNPAFPLNRTLKCCACGMAMTGYYAKGKYPYYSCHTAGCPERNKTIRRDAVESAWLSQLRGLSPSADGAESLMAEVERLQSEEALAASARLKEITSKLAQLETEKSALLKKCVQGVIADEDYKRANAAYVSNIESLDVERRELEAERLSQVEVTELAKLLTCNIAELWAQADPQDRQRVQKALAPDGLAYSREKGFLNFINPPWYMALRDAEAEIVKMARPERFELPTFWFVARRSIQLS